MKDKKTCFMFFYKSLKTCFFMFFMFLMFFFVLFNMHKVYDISNNKSSCGIILCFCIKIM